ncbi:MULTISPECIES: hypothetical protein [unclassified Pantoea]|uniref:hypothetical protein n=1 Tax=unclassified Pantoea TaxID=2630326 RepID=UPI00301DEEBE
MFADTIKAIKQRLWNQYLPELSGKDKDHEDPYNYFSVYFKNINGAQYLLNGFIDDPDNGKRYGIIMDTGTKRFLHTDLATLIELRSKIINFRKNSALSYKNIFLFMVDRYTKLLYLKNIFSKFKGSIVSLVVTDTRSLSHNRYAILKLMLNEYIFLRPSREKTGFSEHDILSMIHGRLWYKHIRQEEYRVKLRLLLDSLVITGDLIQSEGLYWIQSKSINTLVDYEKDQAIRESEEKIRKNIIRLTIVLTALLTVIVLVLLALAGIVNLESIWHKVLEIKPVRFLMKFI